MSRSPVQFAFAALPREDEISALGLISSRMQRIIECTDFGILAALCYEPSDPREICIYKKGPHPEGYYPRKLEGMRSAGDHTGLISLATVYYDAAQRRIRNLEKL